MRYQGGKSRIAKDISEIILKYSDKFGGGVIPLLVCFAEDVQ